MHRVPDGAALRPASPDADARRARCPADSRVSRFSEFPQLLAPVRAISGAVAPQLAGRRCVVRANICISWLRDRRFVLRLVNVDVPSTPKLQAKAAA